MKISYITRARMPTEKAHGLQIAKMCEAYAKLGHEVELIVPYRHNQIRENIFSYYNLKECFRVVYVNIPDTIRFSRIFPFFAFWFQSFFFLYALKSKQIEKERIVCTRSLDVAWWYSKKGYRVICEVHDFSRKRGWFTAFLLRRVVYVVSNSEGTAESLRRYGIESLVAPNGVDLDALKPTVGREEMRKKHNIENGAFVCMYIGALEGWKGYKTLLEASKNLQNVVVVIVGGKDEHIEELQKKYPDVRFLGTRPYREIGNYQNMADILVIPNDPSFVHDQEHTSPIKLFAHLASNVPIVVTDLYTIRNIVSEEEVFFFDGSANSLVQVINHVLKNQADAKHRVKQARVLAQKYTWMSRAENIFVNITH